MNTPTISFEFFPPKTKAAAETLWPAVQKLTALRPKYVTITYGAGGSTRDGTIEAIQKVMADTNLPIGSHLTFLNTTKDDLRAYTNRLWKAGVRHIVALRGDMPGDLEWPLDKDENYFQYTSDFVAGLKNWNPFEISVGCYPEKHPDATSLDTDITALKKKCDAGANRAITQFFFDNADYYRFVEKCSAAGVATPICPGLLPIHDFQNMVRFAKRCQAKVPVWMFEKFSKMEDKPEDALKLAEELLTTQALDLAKNGVEHFHFYTLNKAAITEQTCHALGYKATNPVSA